MSKEKNIRDGADPGTDTNHPADFKPRAGAVPETEKNFITVARVSKLFGTGGEVVLNLYDTFPRGYEDGLEGGLADGFNGGHNPSCGNGDVGPQPKTSYGKGAEKPQSKTLYNSGIEPLFGIVDGLRVPFYAESFRRRGRSGALAEFADIDTPQRAAELVGMELSMEYERDPAGAGPDGAEEGIYPEAMVGFTVRFTAIPTALFR